MAADAGALWRSGADIESLVKFMRERGFSQAQSTEALERVTRFEAIKAQIAVIYSEPWRDRFQQNLELNQQFIAGLFQLGPRVGRFHDHRN